MADAPTLPGLPPGAGIRILRMMGLDPTAAAAPDARVGAEADDDAVRAARGDRGALERLLRAHAPAIARICHEMSPPGEGRDATQAALERIVRQVGRFDPERGGFKAWAFQVARNVCRDRARRRRHRPSAPLLVEPAAREPDPERLADARDRATRLDAALSALPEGMRRAVLAFHVEGRSYAEIARDLDVPPGTVMTWLHRGRRRLREMVDGAAHAQEDRS